VGGIEVHPLLISQGRRTMKSITDLKRMQESSSKHLHLQNTPYKYRILIGMATCGIAAGAKKVMDTLQEEIYAKGYKDIKVISTGCIGMCTLEPILEVLDKCGQKVTYIQVDPDKVLEILEKHILGGNVVEEYTIEKRS